MNEFIEAQDLQTADDLIVFLLGGQAFATSRNVAAHFAKEHRNVMQAIYNLIAQEPELGLTNFQQTVFERKKPSGGRAIPSCMFEMGPDGSALLAFHN